MVTYCTGSARQKRAYFSDRREYIVLDNIEVLFCASENGRNYFAYGPIPFSEFTVADYLSYKRALCNRQVSAECMLALVSPYKKIGRLCSAEMRAVMFLEKTAGIADKPVVINLDGTKCTRKNARALVKLIDLIPVDVYVCATDKRFERCLPQHKTLAFGRATGLYMPRFYPAKRLSRLMGARRIAVM